LRRLAAVLDELALAYDRGTAIDALREQSPEPKADRAALGRRFPQLGLYAATNSLEVPGLPMVGDAIDDLLDIASDLEEALSELRQSGETEATKAFRFGYERHWGAHLHELRLHLYNLLYRA
jgi:hypothetical protein